MWLSITREIWHQRQGVNVGRVMSTLGSRLVSHPQLPGEPPEPIRCRLPVPTAEPLSRRAVPGRPGRRRRGRSAVRPAVAAAYFAARRRATLQTKRRRLEWCAVGNFLLAVSRERTCSGRSVTSTTVLPDQPESCTTGMTQTRSRRVDYRHTLTCMSWATSPLRRRSGSKGGSESGWLRRPLAANPVRLAARHDGGTGRKPATGGRRDRPEPSAGRRS